MIGLVAACALAGGGCRSRATSGKDAGLADATAVVGPTTHVVPMTGPSRRRLPAPEAPMPAQRSFVVLDAGAAPRRALRYRPGGAARELVATARITSKSFADGVWTEARALAPVRDGFGVTTERLGSAAVVHVRGLIGEVDADGATAVAAADAASYLARWRALLERRRADVATDDRGQLGAVTVLDDPAGRAPADARDELVQRWLGLAVPLPAEPIGRGGRWRVVTLLRAGGAVLTQHASYRLIAITSDRMTIAVELERIGEHQDIDVPGLPADARAELIALRRVVTGTLVLGRDGPLPVSGELTAESASHARFAVGDRPDREQITEDTATVKLISR